MEPQIQYARTADGVSIAYQTAGDGILLVIARCLCGPTSRATWEMSESQRLVDAGLRVIRYDGRGSGSSDRTPIDFSMRAQLADSDAVVECATNDERFALMSRGGGVVAAVSYAERHPTRLLHLFLDARHGGNLRPLYHRLGVCHHPHMVCA